MSYRLGIDLGTTYTAAAVSRDGSIEMAGLGGRSDTVASVVLVRDDDSTLVGDAALYRGASEPERLAREFKRRIGDTTPMLLGGSPHSAESLTARLLRWVVDEVSEREGGPPEEIVVTHPANWGPYKVDRLSQAVQLAELEAVRFVTEPEAAAIHYVSQERVDTGAVIAVYDLGGGTFDAAVMRKTDDGFEVLGQPKGIEQLGGIDFDAAVFGHVARALDGALDDLDEDDPAARAAVARLRADCVLAKETLSSDTDVSIPVGLAGLGTEIRLTRAEFEDMIRPPLNESVAALRAAIDEAGIDADDVHAILLVGGSSRIPLVAQLVGAELGRPVHVDIHPKQSIARGAARYEPVPVSEIAGLALATEPGEPATQPVSSLRPPGPGPAPGSPRAPVKKRSLAWLRIAIPVGLGIAVIAGIVALALGGGDGDTITDAQPADSADPIGATSDSPFTTTTSEPATTTTDQPVTTTTTEPTITTTGRRAAQLDDRLLLDQGPMTFTGTRSINRLVENPDGERYSVLLEGSYDVTLTVETGGGPVSGTIEGEMEGLSVGAGNPYSATFTGVVEGFYDPFDGRFEGSVVFTGSTTEGVESSLPTDAMWSGSIYGPDRECPGEESVSPCFFGAVDNEPAALIWTITLPEDIFNPNA